jgi:hypothetical protein
MQVELNQLEPKKEIIYPRIMHIRDEGGLIIAIFTDYNSGVVLYNTNPITTSPKGTIFNSASFQDWELYSGSITLRNE